MNERSSARVLVLAFTAAIAACAGSSHAPSADTAACEMPEPSPTGETGFSIGQTLPNLAWEGIDARGERRTIRLGDYFDPCATSSRLLVVRVQGGAWCGTCRWHAAHTGALRKLAPGRLDILDLVVGDAQNAPAAPEDLAAWKHLVDDTEHLAVAADPNDQLRAISSAPGNVAPLFVVVDTKTMRIAAVLANPSPATLANEIVRATAGNAEHADVRVDGIYTLNEWDLIRDIVTPSAPPSDPTNAVADSPAAAALGKALFFDTGLSANGSIACASCHDPSRQLGEPDHLPSGIGSLTRKIPSIALAAHARSQFWDGRADTLWAQALAPIENAQEMNASRILVVRRLVEHHREAYEAAFPGRPLPSIALLPSNGKPNDPAYDALSDERKEAVTRAFVDAGKAIAAYERRFRVAPNRLDAYARGDFGALSSTEKLGLTTFVRTGCVQCHWGPRLTDDAFHVTRMHGAHAAPADEGRSAGAALLLSSEFHGGTRWSDAPDRAPRVHAGVAGAFKTPSLRGVATATRFGHGGVERTLAEVAELYGRGGAPAEDPRAVGVTEPWLVTFGETSQWSLTPFLQVLTGEPVLP